MFEIRLVGVLRIFYAVCFFVKRAVCDKNLVAFRFCGYVRRLRHLRPERRHRSRIVNDEIRIKFFTVCHDSVDRAVLNDKTLNGSRKVKIHNVFCSVNVLLRKDSSFRRPVQFLFGNVQTHLYALCRRNERPVAFREICSLFWERQSEHFERISVYVVVPVV